MKMRPTGGLTRQEFLRVLGGTAVAALSPLPSWAQASDDADARPRITRILREYDAQGDHRTGTAVDAESGRWLSDRVDDAGIVPEIEWMGFSRIDIEAAYVEIDGRRAYGIPLYDGGTTDAAGVTGALGALDTASEIGLGFEGPRSSQAFVEHRRSTSQRAVVTVTGGAANGVPDGLALMNAPAFTEPFGPPVLQVASEHRDWLREAASSNQAARVVAHVSRRPEEVFNVTATLLGRQTMLPPVLVITPRSGWWTCASERGGGLAVWLEMIRSMAAAPQPARTTVFVASTGHELGHYGLAEFVRTRSRLLTSAHAWIHLGANFGAAIGGGPILQASSDELQTLATEAMHAAGVAVASSRPVGAEPFGEVHTVHEAGGRYLSLIGSNGLFHHPHDRWPTAVDVDRIAGVAQAFTRIALDLGNQA